MTRAGKLQKRDNSMPINFFKVEADTTRYDASLASILFPTVRSDTTVYEIAGWIERDVAIYLSGAVRFISRGGNTNNQRRGEGILSWQKLTNSGFFIARARDIKLRLVHYDFIEIDDRDVTQISRENALNLSAFYSRGFSIPASLCNA